MSKRGPGGDTSKSEDGGSGDEIRGGPPTVSAPADLAASPFMHREAGSYLRVIIASQKGGGKNAGKSSVGQDRDGQEGGTTPSLRAWARKLSINPGFLSQVLSGKRNLSEEKAQAIAEEIGLGEREARFFRLLVRRDSSKDEKMRQSVERELEDLRRASVDEAMDAETFTAIRDWYHIPILEMLDLDGVEWAPGPLADRLGVSGLEATVAMERLERLGLVQRNADGQFERTRANFRFRSAARNEAFGLFHAQMIALAVRAMERRPMDERLVMSQTFSMAKEEFGEARLLTREYIEKMASLSTRGKKRDDTYQLNVQFFRLTDGETKEI